MRETYDTLEEIQININSVRGRLQILQMELSAHNANPTKFLKIPLNYFWKEHQCKHMVDILSRSLDYWQRRYHRTLLNIPYVSRLVEAIKKANAKQAGYKEEIINLLDVFEKPLKPEKV